MQSNLMAVAVAICLGYLKMLYAIINLMLTNKPYKMMKLFQKLPYLLLFMAGMPVLFSYCQPPSSNTEGVSKTVSTTQTMPNTLLRHVVLFKFKDATSQADIEKVETAFRNLPSQIKEIKGFEFGLNNSPENLNQGFTHCFFLSFESEADRAVYLPHPAHKAFGAVLTPHLDKVLVIDYWAGK